MKSSSKLKKILIAAVAILLVVMIVGPFGNAARNHTAQTAVDEYAASFVRYAQSVSASNGTTEGPAGSVAVVDATALDLAYKDTASQSGGLSLTHKNGQYVFVFHGKMASVNDKTGAITQ